MTEQMLPTEEPGRDIPDPIRRQLRQEAGFGCCICGFPFFQYHHIVPFATIRLHDPQHMMLLCPNHHQQATAGALTDEEQQRWKASAFNIAHGNVRGLLFLPTPILIVRGAEWAIVGPFQFVVEDEVIFEVRLDEGGRMLITLNLYDRDDRLLFSVVDNEWTTGDPLPWDFESSYRWLRMRRGYREATISINATREHVRLHAVLRRKGYKMELTNERINVLGPDGSPRIQDVRVIVGLRVLVNPTAEALLKDKPLLPGGAKAFGGSNLEGQIAEAIQFYEDNTALGAHQGPQ